MDPKDLQELQKLKEQKYEDLHKLQDLARKSIPDLDEAPNDEESGGETIKFQPVNHNTRSRTAPPVRPAGGRRGRKITPQEKARKKRKKIRKTITVIVLCLLIVLAVLLALFLGLRKSNKTKYTYSFWGMGLSVKEDNATYSFLGNLTKLTEYDAFGRILAVAEFDESGNCVKEILYNGQAVAKLYTHEYVNGERTKTVYFENGERILQVAYTRVDKNTVATRKIYLAENGRTEDTTLVFENNVLVQENVFDGTKLKIRYNYTNGIIVSSESYDESGVLISRSAFEYDERGNILSENVYGPDGTLLEKTENEYDEVGNCIKKLSYNAQGELTGYDTFVYENGNPVQQISYAADGRILEHLERIFNSKGQAIKVTTKNEEGKVLSCHGFEYSGTGFISKRVIYNTTNTAIVDSYILYSLDAKGNILGTQKYNGWNVLTEKMVYNSAGLLTALSLYDQGGVVLREETYTYDADLHLVKKQIQQYSVAGEKSLLTTEQYDENGNITVFTEENQQLGTYTQTLREYDANGNKAKETLYDKSGRITAELSYKNGLVQKETLFKEGREVKVNEYTYNSQGKIIRIRCTDKLTGGITRLLYEYTTEGKIWRITETDDLGNMLSLSEFNGNEQNTVKTVYSVATGEVLEIHRMQYDSAGRLSIDEILNAEDVLLGKVLYTYNPDGSFYYMEYDKNGILIFDSRNPA